MGRTFKSRKVNSKYDDNAGHNSRIPFQIFIVLRLLIPLGSQGLVGGGSSGSGGDGSGGDWGLMMNFSGSDGMVGWDKGTVNNMIGTIRLMSLLGK